VDVAQPVSPALLPQVLIRHKLQQCISDGVLVVWVNEQSIVQCSCNVDWTTILGSDYWKSVCRSLDQGETERLNESRVDEDALQGAISYG